MDEGWTRKHVHTMHVAGREQHEKNGAPRPPHGAPLHPAVHGARDARLTGSWLTADLHANLTNFR